MDLRIEIPVSAGELVDRLSILGIKRERIADPAKLAHIHAEHALLTDRREAALTPSLALNALTRDLDAVNRRLWDIENALRAMERRSDFGPVFVTAARAVYTLNDDRARLKQRIDALTGSALSEQKSYL